MLMVMVAAVAPKSKLWQAHGLGARDPWADVQLGRQPALGPRVVDSASLSPFPHGWNVSTMLTHRVAEGMVPHERTQHDSQY